MKIQLSPSRPFNLDFTLCCGQTFRWEKQGDWWYGVVGQAPCKIRQTGKTLAFEGVDAGFVENYFRLDDDLPEIFSRINKDRNIEAAISEFNGLRILRQEPWECLISYICATYKSISAIKGMLANLSRRFGEETRKDTQILYTFPKPAKLAKAGLHELLACGLGYRAKYVSETAKLVRENTLDLERLEKMAYAKAKQELTSLPGVGPKVADCVLLFSLEKLQAFPVDVWIRRAILKYYARYFPKEFVKRLSAQESLSSSGYEKLGSFGREYFGDYAGYAQEYLYHHERMHH
ncbi:MAG: DNA glycosylase [Candidatus Bathyarchaeia archaeon]|jgi:N-glycosylase/DNA lyase